MKVIREDIRIYGIDEDIVRGRDGSESLLRREDNFIVWTKKKDVYNYFIFIYYLFTILFCLFSHN